MRRLMRQPSGRLRLAMRFRSTLIFLLIALGLGAYVYFVEFQKATEEAKKKTLFEFKADDATEITLTYPDRTIVAQKIGNVWRLTKPIDAAADETAVRNLINAIAECEVKKDLDSPASDLSTYGLDHPFVTVKVRLKDRDLPAILVGKNTPIGFSTYISRDDDKKIRLANSAFRSGMDKQPKDLRDKTIVSFNDDDVRQISLTTAHENLLLTKKDDAWNIEKPASYAADPTPIRTLLSAIKSMRAVDFPDEGQNLDSYGLEEPRLVIVLHMVKGDEQKAVVIGKENEQKQIYVKTLAGPTIYAVSEWVFRDLNKELKDFRDKTVLAFDKDAVRSAEIKRTDGSSVKLVRGDDQKWKVEGTGAAKPQETAITQYLTDLHDLKGFDIAADKVVQRADVGLDPPALSITLRGANDTPLGTVLIGRRQPEPNKTEYTAMADGGETVFLVRDYLFARLDKQQKDFIEQPTPAMSPTSAALSTAPHEQEDDGEDEPPAEEHFGAEE